ncbi:LysE family translocator [Mesorhizobium caraganae]|uniref:LysE family translocator n=1 Tax=Mesorhizobium caraganae TaxID=483206 RepID=UPI00333DFB5C
MARGIGQGRRVALYTVLGMTAGAGMVQLPLIAFGVSSLVRTSPLALDALQWLGAAYLVWLGLGGPAGYDPDQGPCRGKGRRDCQSVQSVAHHVHGCVPASVR